MRGFFDWLADLVSAAVGALLAWASRWCSIPTPKI
jgi:hypothetical protein